MPEVEIGEVMQFFARPVVAGITLSGELKMGDTIHIKGHTTDLQMVVQSMQIENTPVDKAVAGQAIGIKVTDRVRPGDKVYKLTP